MYATFQLEPAQLELTQVLNSTQLRQKLRNQYFSEFQLCGNVTKVLLKKKHLEKELKQLDNAIRKQQ